MAVLEKLRGVARQLFGAQLHPKIDEPRQRNYSKFRYEGHSSQSLVQAVVAYSKRRGDQLNRVQKRALEKYRTRNTYRTGNADNLPIGQILDSYFLLFDDLFFGESLAGCCKLKIHTTQASHAAGRGRKLHGRTDTDTDYYDGKPVPFNTSHLYAERGSARAQIHMQIETLLHEMVYAFLVSYAFQRESDNRSIEYHGRKGHGYPFLDICFALENAVKDPHTLGKELKLDITNSLAKELVGGKLPIPRDLNRWGVDRDELTKLVDRMKKEKGKKR
jgi:hypothetical protein